MPTTAPIKYELLKRLHMNYLNHKHKLLTRDIGGKFETKAIWFEKNPNLIEFCRAVINDNNISGIRFYLGAYDVVQTNFEGIRVPEDSSYVDQITLAFVTTEEAENGSHRDVYIDPINLILPPENHGKLCPPDTGCEIINS